MPVAGPVERVFQMNIAMKASTATTAPTRSPRVAEFPPALVGVCCLRFFPLTCGDAATTSGEGQPSFAELDEVDALVDFSLAAKGDMT